MRRTYKRLSELVNSSGIEYNDATSRIVTSEEWWNRNIKENVIYKDFKDRDVKEIYIKYRQLFDDSYEADKYAITQ
ncbi:uncharacterized protein LOC111392284 isoform X2 [Olea europaea var. sylvestris]|uniref:uncharacterized protein LOC111392284 isoform X2 n=1 Tax=Olea europaea var. sylvestris TaxID=158386 RepID=UPI000C1CD3E5|nr:uncharacterized protein LOC111392284 isoform X2 [Olea europaea var. sylvestris]